MDMSECVYTEECFCVLICLSANGSFAHLQSGWLSSRSRSSFAGTSLCAIQRIICPREQLWLAAQTGLYQEAFTTLLSPPAGGQQATNSPSVTPDAVTLTSLYLRK